MWKPGDTPKVMEPLIHRPELSFPKDSLRVCCKPKSVGKPKRKLACLLQSHEVRGLLWGRGFPSPRWPAGPDPLNIPVVQGSGAPSLDSQPCPRCPVGSSQLSLSSAPENAPGPGTAGHQECQGLAGQFWVMPLPSPPSLILETGFLLHFHAFLLPGGCR